MCMLRLFFSVFGEFQAPPIGWNINYSAFGHFQWICLDANIFETMPRKTEEKKNLSHKVKEYCYLVGVCFGYDILLCGHTE